MKIEEMNKWTYLIASGNKRIPIIDFYMNASEKNHASVLVAHEEEEIMGFCVFRRGATQFILDYLYVYEQYRRKGIVKALLRSLCNIGEEETNGIFLKISLNRPYSRILEKTVKQLNFFGVDSFFVRSYQIDDNSRRKFQDFLQTKGLRFQRKFEAAGYQIAKLSEVSEETFHLLYHYHENGFEDIPNPVPVLKGMDCRLCLELSNVVFHQGKLVAYSLITSPNESTVILEQYSVIREYQNRGIVLLPYLASLQAVLDGSYKKIMGIVRQENRNSLRILDEGIEEVPCETNEQNCYFYRCIGANQNKKYVGGSYYEQNGSIIKENNVKSSLCNKI